MNAQRISQVPIAPDLFAAIIEVKKLLERDFGQDYSYGIYGRGLALAQSNRNGIVTPQLRDRE